MTLGRAAKVPAGQKRGQARAGAPGGPPARRACRELIRPPARGRHRNHSAAPAPGARGNGPVELTSPDSASRGATACRLLPGGRHGAGRTARGRRGRGGHRAGRGGNGAATSPPARPAGADTPVSLGLSNCPDARRPPFPETAAGPGRSGGLGWPRFPGAVGPSDPRALDGQRPRDWRRRHPAGPHGDPAHRTLRQPRAAPRGGGVRVLALPGWPLGVCARCGPSAPAGSARRGPAEPVRLAPQGLASLLRRQPGAPHLLGLGSRSRRPGSGGRKLADLCLRRRLR